MRDEKAEMSQLETWEDFHIDEFEDENIDEKQTIIELPIMADTASTEILRLAFENRLMETEGQIVRLKENL